MMPPSPLPAHVHISSSIPQEWHDALRSLLAASASLAATDLSECEVHIKQSRRPAHGLHGSRSAFSGMAYFQYTPARKPGALLTNTGMLRVRMDLGIRYLVTLKLTAEFHKGVYPFVWQYRRYKTAPAITLNSVYEEFVHLAVHEFRHVHQYVHGYTRSEIDCEQFSHEAVYRMRALLAKQNPVGKAASEHS